MIQNLTLRFYFRALLSLITILILALGTIGARSIYQNYTLMLEQRNLHILPIEKLYEIEDQIIDPMVLILSDYGCPSEISTVKETPEQVFERSISLFKQLNVQWVEFTTIYPDRRLLLPVIEFDENLKKIANQIVVMEQKGEKNFNHSTEIAIQLHKLGKNIDKLIDHLIEKDFAFLSDRYKKLIDQYFFQLTLLAGLTLGSLAIIWLISLPFIKILLSSIQIVSHELKSLVSEDADLTKRLQTNYSSEIGAISIHFNLLMDNLLDLTKRVQRAGLQVFGSANSISASSKQLEGTVSHFGAFTSEIALSSQLISKTSQALVATMSGVKEISNETALLAKAGKEGLIHIESTICHMEEAFKTIASKLATISEKAANITIVVTTITKIADQTNLLSLNASIEAEKAGEVGLGFAVIARETRRLADQTAVATLDIEKMVSDMKSAVNSGVMSIENFSKELNKYVGDVRKIAFQQATIIEHVQTLTPRFEEVHLGMSSQLATAQQISEAMGQLSEVAHKANEALKQSNLAIEQLNAAARGLQKEVSRFKVAS